MSETDEKPAATVTQDPADHHYLIVRVRGAFGTDEVSLHRADAARLVRQLQAALDAPGPHEGASSAAD